MRLISRHIFIAIAVPFVWALVALTGLMLLQILPVLINNFGGRGLSPWVLVRAITFYLPVLMTTTMPMAVLVATMYAYTSLAGSLEMVAMYANGISVWRMARPALMVAALVSITTYALAQELAPQSMLAVRHLTEAAIRTSPTLSLRQQVLNQLPAPAGYILRADRIDAATGDMKNVTIFDLSVPNTRREIVADSGVMAESPNGRDLILSLHSGSIYEFQRAEPGKLQQTKFEHDVIAVRNTQTMFDQSVNATDPSRRTAEMSPCGLLDDVAAQRWRRDQTRLSVEFMTQSDLRILTGLPLPLRNPTHAEDLKPHCTRLDSALQWLKRRMLPAKLSAQVPPAIQQPGVQQPGSFIVPPVTAQQPLAFIGDVRDLTNAERMLRSNMLMSEVEFHHRIVVSLAPFCFVLIGLALALKYPTSGIGLVIGGSLAIFLGFYILHSGGQNAARAGDIPPGPALYTPLIVMTLIGILAVNAANREMGMSRSGGFFDSIRNLSRFWRR